MQKKNVLNPIKFPALSNLVFNIRGKAVMFDFDLANLYGYEVKRLNEQVKRNIERFPNDFMFRLTSNEIKKLKSQFATSRRLSMFFGQDGGVRYPPYVFTEQGVYMLSTVLKSETAIKQSIFIMRAFREMKHFITNNEYMLERIKSVELKQLEHEKECNNQIKQIWQKINKEPLIQQKIFYEGQIYNAYSCLTKIIQTAKNSIILIDNYIDEKTLDVLSKKQNCVTVNIITTSKGNAISQVQLEKFNAQYPKININYSSLFHDRFLIIDKKTLYHIGASIKDAGNKCFAISNIDDPNFIKNILSL